MAFEVGLAVKGDVTVAVWFTDHFAEVGGWAMGCREWDATDKGSVAGCIGVLSRNGALAPPLGKPSVPRRHRAPPAWRWRGLIEVRASPPPRANAVGPAGPGLCLPHLVCGVHRGRGGACHGCASAAPLHRLTTLPPLLLLPTSQRAGERSMTLPCLSARACPPHPRSEHRLACTPQLRRAARQLDAPGSSRSAVSSAEREGSGFFMDLILEEELPPGSTA